MGELSDPGTVILAIRVERVAAASHLAAAAGPGELTDPVALERPPPGVGVVHDRLRIVGP